MNLVIFLFSFSPIALVSSTNIIKLGNNFQISDENQAKLLFILSQLIESVNIMDMWLQSSSANQTAAAILRNTMFEDFVTFLESNGNGEHFIIEDLGKILNRNKPGPVTCSKPAPYNFFCNYQSFDELIKFLGTLVSKNPLQVKSFTVGTSHEGKNISGIRVSANNNTKPTIWLQAGQHGNEHIGPHVIAYLALQLTSSFTTADKVLLESFDWYLLPVVNPDAYEYSRNVDRMWRKTRAFYPNEGNCTGVDPNRNWDIKWGATSGSSSNPCDLFYSGPSAFSEAETRAVSQYMMQNLTGPLELFIDFHSFAEAWMSPYGYTPALPPTYNEQHRVSAIATAAIKAVHGYEYDIGSSANTLFNITGGARDWAYEVMNATYSYTVELRDNGTYGFLLPPDQIIPTGEEIWSGVKAMVQELVKVVTPVE